VDNTVTYVVANYVDDSFKVTFEDTKTTDDKAASVVYTFEAGGTITKGNAKTADGTAATDVPAGPTAPTNYTFAGWYTTNPTGNLDTLKSDDLSGLTKFDKYTAVTLEQTVYAVYVLSSSSDISDATDAFQIKEAPGEAKTTTDAVFKKDDTFTEAGDGFSPTNEGPYFVTVSANSDYAYISVKFDDSSTATFETSATPAEGKDKVKAVNDTDNKTYAAYVLLDATTGGSVNVVKMVVNAPDGTPKTYVFNVKRYAKAGFTFNYGNSPYGLIMRESAWSDAVKASAKTAFVSNGYKFIADADTTPSTGKTNRVYTTKAWINSTDSNVNMDLNDYAIFAKLSSTFKDPGFTLIDDDGNTIALDDDNNVKISIKYYVTSSSDKVMKTRFVNAASGELTEASVIWNGKVDEGENGDETHIQFLNGKSILPGTYELTYTYQDKDGNVKKDASGNDMVATRPIVILASIGDTDMNGVVNGLDSNIINNRTESPIPDEKTTGAEKFGALYTHRIVDTDNNSVTNGLDSNLIDNRTVDPLKEFYDFEK
jgi:hypothetical protein